MEELHMIPADTHLAVDTRRVAGHSQVADTHLAVDIRRVAVGHIPVVDTRRVAGHSLVADTHLAAVGHNQAVGCYRDRFAEVVRGEHIHHTDLADLDLDPD